MARARAASVLRIALLLAPLSLGLAACETLENLNPFDDTTKKTPLAGERRPLFPEGVPGVQHNAPPQQPTNSNIQIQPQQSPDNPDAQTAPQRAPNAPANSSEDPWAGRRR